MAEERVNQYLDPVNGYIVFKSYWRTEDGRILGISYGCRDKTRNECHWSRVSAASARRNARTTDRRREKSMRRETSI